MAVRKLRRLLPEHYEPALAATLAAFPPGNSAGVFGAAVQKRRVLGRKRPGYTVAVFVMRKELEPTTPIESIRFELGERVFEFRPDVVATGQ